MYVLLSITKYNEKNIEIKLKQKGLSFPAP